MYQNYHLGNNNFYLFLFVVSYITKVVLVYVFFFHLVLLLHLTLISLGWKVIFKSPPLREFWKLMTQFTIGFCCNEHCDYKIL